MLQTSIMGRFCVLFYTIVTRYWYF